MRYIHAKNSEEIGKALRGDFSFSEEMRANIVADRLLGKSHEPGIVVVAPRQSGKTTELLKFAEELYPNGQFAVACLNRYMQSSILHIYRDLMGNINATPPLMITPQDSIMGIGKKIFVDECDLLSEMARQNIFNSGLFVAAVTS